MELTIEQPDKVTITDKEIEIVRMLSEGHKASGIGRKMKLSVRTVETYLLLLRRKTLCKTNAQLVAFFMRKGLIE